jgi:nitrate reductase delta subunit
MAASVPELRRQLLGLFARLLEYPEAESMAEARACEELLAGAAPEAARYLAAFRRYLERTPIGRVQEAYTAFFDLNPVCAPYLGYQLFGENYRRSVLMLALVDRYRAQGFEFDRSELPDRVSVVMRYAAASGDDDLVVEGLIPALRRMTGVEQGPPVDGQGPAGGGSPQLEGHSHGGHLEEGVLLEMTEGSTAGSGRRAFEALLTGIRLALEALWSAPATVPAGRPLEAGETQRQNGNGRVEEA